MKGFEVYVVLDGVRYFVTVFEDEQVARLAVQLAEFIVKEAAPAAEEIK